MRVAALYDIHGNLPALEAVLEEVAALTVDHLVIGGDVVPGPMPSRSLDLLSDLATPTSFLHGNGDREVMARMRGEETPWYTGAAEAWREPVRWSAEVLTAAHRSLLESWPAHRQMALDGLGEVLFCHATPNNDVDIFTRRTDEALLRPAFASVAADVVVCGHTHMQFDRTIGRTRVVNAGSVGMPFGEPGAYWLLFDPEPRLHRTRYDLDAAAARIRSTAYPQKDDFATRSVLVPPTEAEMLEAFAKAESTAY